MSHTVTIDVKFKSTEALTKAVESLGGSVIGFGEHCLYGLNKANGFAFNLPDWRYPLVATESGTLAFDNYNGRWGSEADVQRLQAEYGFQAAKIAADQLGWLTERVSAGDHDLLRVYHPDGGYLDVDASSGVEAFGFSGVGCQSATNELGQAMGDIATASPKQEFYDQEVQNRQSE